MKIITIILMILICHITGKITNIVLSRLYGKKCKYNCNNCGMWSCTYNTDYKDYYIDPYNDYSNVCGKFEVKK